MENPITKVDELESLKEDVRILTSHISFMRSQLQISRAKLDRNEKLLKIYIEALTEKEEQTITYKFSLN